MIFQSCEEQKKSKRETEIESEEQLHGGRTSHAMLQKLKTGFSRKKKYLTVLAGQWHKVWPRETSIWELLCYWYPLKNYPWWNGEGQELDKSGYNSDSEERK